MHVAMIRINYEEPEGWEAASILAAYQGVTVLNAPTGTPTHIYSGDVVADWWTAIRALLPHQEAGEVRIAYSTTVLDFLRDSNGLYVWNEEISGLSVNAVRVAAA